MKYLIALDQGTTSSRAVIFDENRNKIDVCQKEFQQIFPKPGWVEHNPKEILSSQLGVLDGVIGGAVGGTCGAAEVDVDGTIGSGRAGRMVCAEAVAAIGITNQRETTIVWDKRTGEPVYNAIVWQCRRTADYCEELKAVPGMVEKIREKTGLVIDAYFSATKIKWILENVPGLDRENLLFGTVDTWLVWNMTGGKAHVTDYTNASRTMLFNIKDLCWDRELLDLFGIPESMLPEVRSSAEIYGHYNAGGVKIPIAGMAGDQQCALFGQQCFEPGQAKNTYGTGCFLLMNIGEECRISQNGLLTTIGIGLKDRINYAMEGSVFIGGAVIQWLRDGLKIIENSSDSGIIADRLPDNGGVYFVPAFTGLGAPYWDMYARGAIMGITRGTTEAHIVRAAVESMAFQTMELLDTMVAESGVKVAELNVDGGACRDSFLMQFQADVSEIKIRRPKNIETTALGAALLAGLGVGLWESTEEISRLGSDEVDRVFSPQTDRKSEVEEWKKCVGRILTK